MRKKSWTKWTKKEIEFLLKHRFDYSLKEMATRVGHPTSSIFAKIHQLGFTWRKTTRVVKKWSSNDDQFLKNNYGKISVKEIAQQLKRTSGSIWSRVGTMKLWKQSQKEISTAPEFKLTDNETAYIAGIIDGEGYFGVICTWYFRKKDHRFPGISTVLAIGNTNLELINFLLGKLKIDYHYSVSPTGTSKRVMHSVHVYQRAHLEKIFSRISPYLIVKRKEAKHFLKILKLKRLGSRKLELLRAIMELEELKFISAREPSKTLQRLRRLIKDLSRDI